MRELIGFGTAIAGPQAEIALSHEKVALLANALGTPPPDVIDNVLAKGNQPVSVDITLKTTRTVTPAGTPCTPFGSDCLLPNISVHDDITTPKFRFNGGVVKGSSTGKATGKPIFPVCTGADTNPKNGIPDIVEQSGGPGSKCKTIGRTSSAGRSFTRCSSRRRTCHFGCARQPRPLRRAQRSICFEPLSLL